jgi:hypothetical protein
MLEWINDYGTPRYSRGAVSLVLDKTSIELAADGDPNRRAMLERHRGTYAIVGDGDRISTVAKQHRRHRH